VKLVMTLLARDEADIVDAQVAFHLHAGVDFVIATDNSSQDGTTEILERYERAGRLHLIREDSDDMRQGEWVTAMARLAATDFGADWILHSDADEFWWPRAGSLKDVLATVPDRYGLIRGCWRHFLPRPHVEPFFAERMTVRLRTPSHPGDKETIFHANQKVAHRAHPDIVVEPGNHDASADGLEPIRGWHPLEVLHFSLRSLDQVERKAVRGWSGWKWNEPARMLHQALAYEALRGGRVSEYYESFVVTDDELERGVADGRLRTDTRLRDALRSLRDGSGFRLPELGRSQVLAFPHPDIRADAEYAEEASILVEIDGIVRAEGRVEAFEQRLAALEQGPVSRLRRLARR
jgi:hypothetical protein